MALRQVYPNVLALDDQRIATPNLAPGTRVYDEDLLTIDGVEWRTWNPMRSKLGSYIVKGGRNFPLNRDSKVVYLGAANGTTPSHVSDIVREGVLVAVAFSPRSFRDLMRVASARPNMLPILADAWRPELYERFVGKVDLLFQDIAQRQQAQIFAKNLNVFKPTMGILAVKARSVDVAANPRDVYEQVAAAVESLSEYRVIETVDLGPFEKDHAALVVVPGQGERKPRQAERRDERPQREDRPRFERRDDRPQQRFDRGDRPRGPPREGGGYGGKPRYGGGGGGGYGGGGGSGGGDRPKYDKRPYDKRDRPAGNNRPDRRGWR